MKTGRTLTELAKELERQIKSKKDYLADTRSLAMKEDGVTLRMRDNGSFGINENCHTQIANRVGIPTKYYNRMMTEAPELLSRNVNHWFQGKPERRMVRTIDGRARAFLSDRYRPLDNYDLAETVLPKIQEMECRIESAEVTDLRMYIKATTDRIQAEVKKGDVVQAGIVISNSEVGLGSVRVEPMVLRLVCMNGAIMNDFSMRKYHVGRGSGDIEFDGAAQFFRDETRKADDRAFWMKVRDVVEGSLDEVKFRMMVERLKEASERKIQIDPVKVVERTKERFVLNEDEQGSVLRHLIEGGELSSYGLHNAVTRTSQDVPSYDRATELERIGGEIISMSSPEWDKLAATL